jgi:hypothetical protein
LKVDAEVRKKEVKAANVQPNPETAKEVEIKIGWVNGKARNQHTHGEIKKRFGKNMWIKEKTSKKEGKREERGTKDETNKSD